MVLEDKNNKKGQEVGPDGFKQHARAASWTFRMDLRRKGKSNKEAPEEY
jgi:hypothetical protein